jgi:hypothetical protein
MIPVPMPEVSDVIVIHSAFEVAVHGQPAPVCTWKVWPVAPDAETLALAGERVVLAAQPSAWSTMKVWPPAETAPVRPVPVFGATA